MAPNEGPRAFPLPEVVALIAGCPGGGPRRLESTLRRDATARSNASRLGLMAGRLGFEDDVLRLFTEGGGAVAEAWVERGELPGGGRDPEHRGYSDASRKNMYSTLSMLANPAKCCAELAAAVPEAARARFRARLEEATGAVRGRVKKNLLSEREMRSILPWGTIMERYAKRRSELQDPQDRLIVDWWLACPMEFPPKRRDFGRVRVMRAPPRLGPEAGDRLVLPARGPGRLRLSGFKTDNGQGFETDLPAPLDRIVREDLDQDAGRGRWRRYLFHARKGDRSRPLNDAAFGLQVATAFERLTGVPVGISNLRKSFVTHLLSLPDKSDEELEEVAARMMHSRATQMGYRRVNIKDSLAEEGGGASGGGASGARVARTARQVLLRML